MMEKTGRTFKAAAGAAGAAALLVLLACVPPARAADWPMFRGNAERTGHISEQAAPPLAKIWEFQAAGGIVSSPAVYDGRVYVGSRANKLYALDADTGALLWERLTAGWVDSSPAVSGGTVYAACRGGRLYALDRFSGAVLWIADLGASSASSPLVLGGRVYVGTGSPENKLKVYDAATGAQLGSYQAAQPVDSAPSTDGSYVYFGANDGQVYALGALSLAPRWAAYPTLGSFGQNAVAVSSGVLYFLPGRDEKKASAMRAEDGALLADSPFLVRASTISAFEVGVPWMQAGSPAIDAGGYVYFTAAGASAASGNPAGHLAALSSGTLSAVWPSSASLGGASAVGVLASPAVANEVIYAATPGGRLIAVSSSGVPLADLDLSSPAYSSPAVSNGLVVAANYGGLVTGYRAGRRAALSFPAAGEVLSGTVSVTGYFASPDLAGYELEYSTGGQSPQWTRISSAAAASPGDRAALGDWGLSGLANGEYTLRLSVLESAASGYDGTALARVRVNAVPQSPSGLSAADVPADTGNAISLAWTASPTAGISAYRLYRDDGNGYILLASTPGLSYVDGAAVTGLAFVYAVSGYDGWAESALSEEAEAVSVNDSGDSVAPGAVTDLAAEPGPGGGLASLTWTAPGDDADIGEVSHYLIRRSTDPAQDWGAFDTLSGSSMPAGGPAGITESGELGGLFGGVTYYFMVKAVDETGNSGAFSNVASTWAARDPLPPLPPAGLAVEDTPGDDGESLTLSWVSSPDDGAGAGDVYGYKIFRRLLNAAFVSSAPYAQFTAPKNSYTDVSASKNVRFYYAVAAYDSSNDSALSAEASGISADNYIQLDKERDGSVRLADGASVEIPVGALNQNASILFTRVDPATYQALAVGKAVARANPTNVVYKAELKGSAAKLVGKARVMLPYTDADVAGMIVENLRVYTLSPGGAWTLVDTSLVDAAAKKVSAEVSHFSFFTIMEYLPSGGLFSGDEIYTYPNPAKGETVTFKFRLSDKAFVKVDVYNVAGEQVASLEKANCPAGQTSEIVWITKNIASGIYVYRVRAESASGNKAIIKKLAIIH